MLRIAHRGASYDAPESTQAAYCLACRRGAAALEADLQLTADGVIVIHHDADLARTTDVAARFPDRAAAPLAAFTLAELQQLDAGAWFNAIHPDRARSAYANQRLLTLDTLIDIAEAAPHRPLLYLETKDPHRDPSIEQRLATLLHRRRYDRVMLESFDPDSLSRLARVLPALPRALLWPDGTALALASRLGCMAINPDQSLTTPDLIAAAHAQDLAMHAWTVNTPDCHAALAAAGIDGVFSDCC